MLNIGGEVLDIERSSSGSEEDDVVDQLEGEESEDLLEESALSSRFMREINAKYDQLKVKQEEQEEKLKDVLIVPKRMEYKVDELRSELKE